MCPLRAKLLQETKIEDVGKWITKEDLSQVSFKEKMTPGTHISFKIRSVNFSTKHLDKIWLLILTKNSFGKIIKKNSQGDMVEIKPPSVFHFDPFKDAKSTFST